MEEVLYCLSPQSSSPSSQGGASSAFPTCYEEKNFFRNCKPGKSGEIFPWWGNHTLPRDGR